MSCTLHPHYTPKRHAWLRTLADHPGSFRENRVGFDCMRLGWTEWVSSWADEDGRHGEQLTDSGREQLAVWDRLCKKDQP